MGGDPGGVRANLAGVGVTYGVNYAGEFFDVARGGVTRGTSINGREAPGLPLRGASGEEGGEAPPILPSSDRFSPSR